MPRYIFSNGKITVEEGLYTPLKREEKRPDRGILILAKPIFSAGESQESTKKEQSHDHE